MTRIEQGPSIPKNPSPSNIDIAIPTTIRTPESTVIHERSQTSPSNGLLGRYKQLSTRPLSLPQVPVGQGNAQHTQHSSPGPSQLNPFQASSSQLNPLFNAGTMPLVTPVTRPLSPPTPNPFITTTGALLPFPPSQADYIPLPGITRSQSTPTQATMPPYASFIPPATQNFPSPVQTQKKGKKQKKKASSVSDAFQFILSLILAFIVPFGIYTLLNRYNIDISHIMYVFVVISLLATAYFIGVEALVALRVDHPPKEPVLAYPPASAIIAAYLPNEAETIVETVNAMLYGIEYPAPFQLILAYNTPRDLPVENVLREMARRDPRLLLLRVENSTSKAENVNRALQDVRGDFVGVFDADHHPAKNAFTRAWRWLAQGYDVVQGHCVVRNGDKTWVARLVAVDFEVIYALGHPGRTRMHGFGVFGGSNGYWRTGLLRQTGMRHSMLTEDIDSALRVVQQGYTIAYDPLLVSRELAPETMKALWNQRMRWAQGWFQVSLKHFFPTLRSSHLSFRQKLGIIHLLFWREIYLWISVQVIPIIVFQALHGNIDWLYPPFLISTIFTLCIGPTQVLLAYFAAAPEIRRHKGWFISYALLSILFFTAWKNHISRIAHLKEMLGEREWKVTPRKG